MDLVYVFAWMCCENCRHRLTLHSLSLLNRTQFKDCYNLQPLSTCHVVIYGTWFRFANSPKKPFATRSTHWLQEDFLHFPSVSPFALPFPVTFGRFGYHPAITAIQLYNRIKTLHVLSLLLSFFCFRLGFFVCAPNNLLSLMLSYRILVGYGLLLQYLCSKVLVEAYVCVIWLMPDQSWGPLVPSVGSFGTDYKLCVCRNSHSETRQQHRLERKTAKER